MSLTSYRAAPPRGGGLVYGPPDQVRGWRSTIGAGLAPGLSPVMSLTSYRAAPPRGGGFGGRRRLDRGTGALLEGSGDGAGVKGGFGEPGGDLLFRRLSGSTIGAEGFHGRVRDGIGCFAPRCGHQAGQTSLRPRCAFGAPVLVEGSPGGPSAHRLDRWVDPGPRTPVRLWRAGLGRREPPRTFSPPT